MTLPVGNPIDVAVVRVEADTDPVEDQLDRGLNRGLDRVRRNFQKLEQDGNHSLRKLASGMLSLSKIFTITTAAAAALQGSLHVIAGTVAALGPAIAAGLAAAPGLILSAVSAMAVFQIATQGVGEALKAAAGDADKFNEAIEKLAPTAQEFARAIRTVIERDVRQFQRALQNRLFDDTGEAILRLSSRLKQIQPAAAGVAVQLNQMFLLFLRAVDSDQVIGSLNGTLRATSAILDGIKTGLAPLITGFTGLAAQIEPFAEGIGSAIGNALSRFGEFLGRVNLAEVFANAAGPLQALATIGENLGQIFSAVFEAFRVSGTDALAVFGALTGKLADLLNSVAGQGALNILAGLIDTLSDSFGSLLQAAIPVIAAIVRTLEPALNTLLTALHPVLTALGDALVPIVESLAPVLGGLGQVLSETLGSLAPLLTLIGEGLTAFIGPLSQFLGDLLVALAPELGRLIEAIRVALLPLFEQLGPAMQDVARQLAPLIPDIVDLVVALTEVVVTLTPLMPLLAELLVVSLPLLSVLVDLVGILLDLSAIWIRLVPMAGEFGEAVGLKLGGAFRDTLENVRGFIDGTVEFFRRLPGRVGEAISSLPGRLVDFMSSMFDRVTYAVGYGIGRIIRFHLELPGQIVGAIASLPGRVHGIFVALFVRASSATDSGASRIRDLFAGLFRRARAIVSDGFDRIVEFFRSAPGRAREAISSLPGQILGLFSSMVSRAYQIGRDIIFGLANGIKSAVQVAIDAAVNAMKSILKGAKDALEIGSPSKAFAKQVGAWIPPGIGEGVKSAMPQLDGLFARLPGILTGSNTSTVNNNTPINVIVNAAGPMTQQQAHQIGQAVGAGIQSTLVRRNVRMQVRTV